MEKNENSKSNQKIKRNNKLSIDINVDEELGNFVSQIEEKSFAIISERENFELLKKSNQELKRKGIEKMSSFEKQINKIESSVTMLFNDLNQRLSFMEYLSFHPDFYHPFKIITINNLNKITSVSYSHDLVYIGTDTSKVFVYSLSENRMLKESMCYDNFSIINIWCLSQSYIAIQTNNKHIYISDARLQRNKCVINMSQFACWPNDSFSHYFFVTYENDSICIYDKNISICKSIPIKSNLLSPAPNKLISINNKKVTIFAMDSEVKIISEFDLNFEATLITSSSQYFVVSGLGTEIIICNYDGIVTSFNVGVTSKFLFNWENYFFQAGDETIIKCYDFEMKNDAIIIGDNSWWPHHKLSACCICESVLLTADDKKCILWK